MKSVRVKIRNTARLIVVSLVLIVGATAQNNYYVTSSGSGTTCSQASPCTIAQAIASFSLSGSPVNNLGAIIHVLAGSYSPSPVTCAGEGGTLVCVTRGGSSTTNRLRIQCDGSSFGTAVANATAAKGQCKITNGTFGIVATGNANNFDIVGFDVGNQDSMFGGIDIIRCAGTAPNSTCGNSVHILSNYVHDMEFTGGTTEGGQGCPDIGAIGMGGHGWILQDPQVIGNIVDNYGVVGCHFAHDIYMSTRGGIIYNNITTRAGNSGIHVYSDACSTRVSNNVMANNADGLTLNGNQTCTAGLNTVDNNVIVNNSNVGVNNGGGGPECTTGFPSLFSDNIMSGNVGGNFFATASCETFTSTKSEAPTTTFVNYTGTAAGDYHLKTGSVGIQGGTVNCVPGGPSPCTPTTDIVGAAFPSPIDVGAYSSGGSGVNNYYVATTGNDANTAVQAQNPATPWQTPTHAIANFTLGTTGATIHVKAGTYAAFDINRGGSSTAVRLAVQCDDNWSVPSSTGCKVPSGGTGISVNANNVDLVNWDIGGDPNMGEGIIIPCSASSGNVNCSTGNSVHIIHNYVHNMGANQDCSASAGVAGILFNNHHGPFLTDAQAIGNRVTNIGQTAPCSSGNGMHGIYMNTGNFKIWNNIVTDTQGYSIHVYGYDCFGSVSNNIGMRSVIKSGMVLSGDGSCTTPGSVTIDNNIFDNNAQSAMQLGTGGGAECSSTHPILVSNNIFGGNVVSNSVSGANSCSTVLNTKIELPSATFAAFSNSSGDQYQLKSTSVAVAGGTAACVVGGPTPCVPTTDFLGNPMSIPPPIGAYTSGSVSPVPTVLSILPTAGSTVGGTAINIQGTGFIAGSTVSLGGTAATGVTVVSTTTITATTVAHAAGVVSVVVTNANGTGTLTNGYTYAVPPTVTSISPNSGGSTGGTGVTVSGTGFVSGATVSLGGSGLTGVSVGGSSITGNTSSHAAGVVNVVVTNPNGLSGTLANGYTYLSSGSPHLVISPTTDDCGSSNVGVTVACPLITVSNTGSVSGTITARSGSGDFSTTGNGTCGSLPITIAAGNACNFSPNFTPSAAGTRTGTLTLTSNDPASPTTSNLTGTGGGGTVNNYYMSASGSDANNGTTPSTPWATFAHADTSIVVGTGGTCAAGSGWISSLTVGACVHVATGNYSQDFSTTKNGTATAHVRYVSDTQYGARMLGANGSIMWISHGQYTDVVGFDFDGSVNQNEETGILTYAPDGGTNQLLATHLWALRNRFHDLSFSGSHRAGAAALAASGVTGAPVTGPGFDILDSNLIYHNNGGATAPLFSDGDGAGDVGWGGIWQNNIVMDQGGGSCLQVTHKNETDVIIRNNTFVNCPRSAITFGSSLGQTANSTITNNIFGHSGSTGRAAVIIVQNGCDATNLWSNNLLYANFADYTTTVGCANPLVNSKTGSDPNIFVNYTGLVSGDYHLKTGSPAVTAGITNCAASGGVQGCPADTVDFANTPMSSPPPMGALTFGGGSLPSPVTGLVATPH